MIEDHGQADNPRYDAVGHEKVIKISERPFKLRDTMKEEESKYSLVHPLTLS